MLSADARNGQNAVEGIGLFGPGIGGGVQYVIGGHGLRWGLSPHYTHLYGADKSFHSNLVGFECFLKSRAINS